MLDKLREHILKSYQFYSFSKKDIYIGLGLFFFVLIFYMKTMGVGLGPGDSGELSSAVYFWGIPHAPGYSLLMIVSKLFTYIPYKNIAWRLNFFSAFCASSVIVLMYLLLLKLLITVRINRYYALISSLSGSLVFAFSKTFWTQVAFFEVYILSTLFYPLFFLIFFFWIDSLIKNFSNKEYLFFGERYLMLYAFLFGLSVVSHLSLLMTEIWGFFIIASGFYLFIFPKRLNFRDVYNNEKTTIYPVTLLILNLVGYGSLYGNIIRMDSNVFNIENVKQSLMWFVGSQVLMFLFYVYDVHLKPHRFNFNNYYKRIYYISVKLFFFFYLGYFTNIYVYIRSKIKDIPISWGGIGFEDDFFSKIAKLLNLLWRKQYGDQGSLPISFFNLYDQFKINIFEYNFMQYNLFFNILIIFGIYQSFKKNIYIGLILIVGFVSYNLQTMLYLSMDVYGRFAEISDVFFMFSYFCTSMYIAFGITWIFEKSDYILKRFYKEL